MQSWILFLLIVLELDNVLFIAVNEFCIVASDKIKTGVGKDPSDDHDDHINPKLEVEPPCFGWHLF